MMHRSVPGYARIPHIHARQRIRITAAVRGVWLLAVPVPLLLKMPLCTGDGIGRRSCGGGLLAATVAIAMAAAASGAPAMPLADVPLFRLRCRVAAVTGPPAALPSPGCPSSDFSVGCGGVMGPTTDTVRSNGTGWSGWTTFNATHANTTTRQYPNWAGHEPEFGPFPMLVARLVVVPHQLTVPQHEPYFVTIDCEWLIDPSAAHPRDQGVGTLSGRL